MDMLERDQPAMVSELQLKELTEFACRLADASGRAILPHFRSPLAVHNKANEGAYDPVTQADRGAETAIRELIGKTYPDHGIFGEEHGYEAGASPLTWVIDPLDGTRSFITGALHWGTLIALFDGQQPLLGVVDQPYTRERFTGNRLGAFFTHSDQKRKLVTRQCDQLSEAVLYTTSPDILAKDFELPAFRRLSERVRLVRYGGDCYSYCMLALGYVDLVVESGLHPYDVQALIPIVEQAGGRMTCWDGESANNGGRILAAGNSHLHARAMEILAG